MKTNFFNQFNLKIKRWYLKLPDKKIYFELATAILSVPLALTVIMVNVNNINKSRQNPIAATTTIAPIQIIVEPPLSTDSGDKDIQKDNNQPKTTFSPTPTPTLTPTITPTSVQCKKDIGEIKILSPQEGEIINNDNVCINISTDSNYCPVTWSYKLNNDDWSSYSSNDICLYNLTSGNKTLQIIFKSASTNKTVTLQRTFTYQTPPTPTLNPTVTSTTNEF